MRLHTRREFLTASRNLGLSAAATALLPRMAFGEAMGLPPAIQLYTVREDLPKDTPGTLKMLHDIGFREIETASFGKYSVKEFRMMLDDAGLKAPSAHYATSSSLATGNLPPRPAGSPRVPMAPLGLDGFTKLAEQMNGIGAKAKAAGLQY